MVVSIFIVNIVLLILNIVMTIRVFAQYKLLNIMKIMIDGRKPYKHIIRHKK